MVKYRYALAFLCGSLLTSVIINLLKRVILGEILRPSKYFECPLESFGKLEGNMNGSIKISDRWSTMILLHGDKKVDNLPARDIAWNYGNTDKFNIRMDFEC